MIQTSFASTSLFPSKLLLHDEIIKSIKDGRIPMYHVRISPTNKCPSNCSFCSCKNRDKSLEIKYSDLLEKTDTLIGCGMRAATLTGGGDPLAYPDIYKYMHHLYGKGIDAGLITEGLLFNKADPEALSTLKWCRISISDERKLQKLDLSITKDVNTSWSFSYVLLENSDLHNIIDVINFVNENRFSHVRFIPDMTAINGGPSFLSILWALKSSKVDTSKVIWQEIPKPQRGDKRCLVSLLKPNLDASGELFPCCDVQFADEKPSMNWGESHSMGENIEKIHDRQDYFDGSKCINCHYSEYNKALNLIYDHFEVEHMDFI